MKIVSRNEWGAKNPLAITLIATPTNKVYIHHTAGSERGAAGMRQIQAGHMRPKHLGGRGFRDIAYSFVIDGDDGVIYEGRGVGVKGGHVHGDENSNHGICLMGNYENEHLGSAARQSLIDLLRHGRNYGWWEVDEILGHRQEPDHEGGTACPGQNLYSQLPMIRQAAQVVILNPIQLPQEEDEMFLYSSPGEPVFFCDGGVSVGINEASDMETFTDQKLKHFKLDNDTFAKFRQRYPGS